jgi:AcrR family transcriptional regulator
MTTSRPETTASKPRRKTARTPVRERGIQRQALLLDATEQLLTIADPEDIGIYQIAEQAGVAPASVYHFFPTKDAAFVALAQRYLADFWTMGDPPAEAARLKSWQDYFEIEQDRVRAYFNAHRPALKLFYGGYASPGIREFDARFNAQMTSTIYGALDRLFHMPHLADPGRKFQIAHAILEAVWTQSYFHHGRITEDYARDALEAHRAYCRLFLPERIEPRDWVKAAAERGETIVLDPSPEALGRHAR